MIESRDRDPEEVVTVHDLAGREQKTKRKNLKPSTWQQGDEVFTVI